MAITTNAITNSFKEQTFQGIHNFTVSTGVVTVTSIDGGTF